MQTNELEWVSPAGDVVERSESDMHSNVSISNDRKASSARHFRCREGYCSFHYSIRHGDFQHICWIWIVESELIVLNIHSHWHFYSICQCDICVLSQLPANLYVELHWMRYSNSVSWSVRGEASAKAKAKSKFMTILCINCNCASIKP